MEKLAAHCGFSGLRVCTHHLEVVSGSHLDSESPDQSLRVSMSDAAVEI